MFIDEAELEELGAEPTATVVAGLETGVELGDGDRSTIEQNLSQPFHPTILNRAHLRFSTFARKRVTALRQNG